MTMIRNAGAIPLNAQPQGMVPDVSGALQGYYQPLTFAPLVKAVSGFQVVESATPIQFQGVIQPFSPRRLLLLPEGQRAWSWYLLHADPVLTLQVDDVVLWQGKQTRVMSRTNYTLFGYVEYSLCQDWEEAGPL